AVPAGRRTGAGLEHCGADPGARRRPARQAEGVGPPRPQAGRVAGSGAATMRMREALRGHWPEYAMEAAGLAVFMVSACVFVVLLEHPDSRAHLLDPVLRR